MPRTRDPRTGIPQALAMLFEQCLLPLRHGLGAVGLTVLPAEAEPRFETALLRAWRIYREAAIECLAGWADVDERYRASAARFQEHRWELAAGMDVAAIRERRVVAASDAGLRSIASQAAAAAAVASAPAGDGPEDGPAEPITAVIVRPDSETLIPISG